MNNGKVVFDEKMKDIDELHCLSAENARLQLQLDNAILYAKIVTEENFEMGRRKEDKLCSL